MTIEDIAADAVQAHVPRTAGEFGRPSDEHAASPVVTGLGRVEAEHASGRRSSPDHPARLGGGQGVRGILYHLERVPRGHLQQGRHGAGEPAKCTG